MPRAPRIVPFLLLAVLVGAAGAVGVIRAADTTMAAVERVDGVADEFDLLGDTVENFLLVGTDSREGADPDAPDYGGIGDASEVSGSRSDTIMILRLDRRSGDAALMSVPRDLWVEIPGRGADRINSAYRDGPAGLVRTVRSALLIPVHHYLEIDFNGFKDLIGAVGGVEVCVEYPIRDVHTGLYLAQPGCHLLDPVQSLAYARSRYYEEYIDGEWVGDGRSDLGRVERQQYVVDTALRTALDAVLADPFLAGEVAASAAGALRIDAASDLVATAMSLRPAIGAGITRWSLPVRPETIDGKAVLVLTAEAGPLIEWFRGTGPMPVAQD